MSRYSGRQGKGAARRTKIQKREEALARIEHKVRLGQYDADKFIALEEELSG